MKKFELWFAEHYGEDCGYGQKGAARDAWIACKSQILDVLRKKHGDGIAAQLGEYIPSTTFRELEEL